MLYSQRVQTKKKTQKTERERERERETNVTHSQRELIGLDVGALCCSAGTNTSTSSGSVATGWQ